jgi:hypothetical protein
MGRQIAEKYPRARDLYERAGKILGYDLAKRCFEGPAAELDTTEISQPAIFVTSLAALEMLRTNSPELASTCAMARSFTSLSRRLGMKADMPPMAWAPRVWQVFTSNSV